MDARNNPDRWRKEEVDARHLPGEAEGVAQEQCTECDGTVELETDHVGPWGARALMPPLRILCEHCRVAMGLEPQVEFEGGRPFVLLRGEEFVFVAGAFVRSGHPWNSHVYRHDQPQQ